MGFDLLQHRLLCKQALFCIIFSVILLLITVHTHAQGNLLVTPRRVIFEGQKRLQELNIANVGNDTARYVISLIEIKMNEDGSFQNITAPDSGQHFASSYLRFFPRNVTLPPKEAQVVKIQLQRSADLTPGEYRSHLYFRAVPKPQPLGEDSSTTDSSTISVRLVPVFGLTIPVIIRLGPADTKTNLSDITLSTETDTIPVLSVIFKREGNMSVYGDVNVEHISTTGKVTVLGLVRGVAVYTPTRQRLLRIPLYKVKGLNLHTGKIHISYQAQSTQMNVKPVTLAEGELPLH